MKILRYFLCWPRFLGWLFPLLAVCLFFAKNLSLEPDLILTAEWRPWWAKRWKYATTLAAGMIFHTNSVGRVFDHECVHLRQAEDNSLSGLVLASAVVTLTGSLVWLVLWPLGLLWPLPHYVMAVMRGGHIYRDVEHERSAYAQTDYRPGTASSWLEEHLKTKRSW